MIRRTLTTTAFTVILFMSVGAFALAAPIEIDFWHIWPEGQSDGDYIREMVDEFNALHEGQIKVNSIVTDFWTFDEKFRLALAAGVAPDILHADAVTAKLRAKEGLIVNLSPYLARDGLELDEFWPGAVDIATHEGDVYALPFNPDTRVLYYNRAHFLEAGLDANEPPITWNELETLAQRLTRRSGDGSYEKLGFHPFWGNLTFLLWAWTNGGDMFDADGVPTIDAPENIEALEWAVDWLATHGKSDVDAFFETLGGKEPFTAEGLSMIVETNSYNDRAQIDNPMLDYGMGVIPYNREEASWSAGFDVEIVKTTPQRHDASWEFVKYMVSEDVMQEWVQRTRSLGARPRAATAAFPDDPNWIVSVNQMLTSKFTPYSYDVPLWWQLTFPHIDQAIALEESPASALRKAQDQVMAQYQEAIGQ